MSYAFSGGDSGRIGEGSNPVPTRGVFGYYTNVSMRDITDGSSNTVLVAELSFPVSDRDIGHVHILGTASTVPNDCRATFNTSTRRYESGTVRNTRGHNWADGGSLIVGVNTILPPNSPSCTTEDHDGRHGIFSAGSKHTGGAHALMGDGSVRFISENIHTGNLGVDSANPSGPSNYGVWGALGTKNGGEVVGEF